MPLQLPPSWKSRVAMQVKRLSTVPLPPLTIRRTHPERFYSFWALGLHGLSYVGMLPVSTWWIAVATGAGSIVHSCTWNRKYYDLRYDLLLHWSPFLWVHPDWDPKGLGFLLLTLMFYVAYHGGIENVLEIYKDAKCAYLEEDYLVRRALDAIASQDGYEDMTDEKAIIHDVASRTISMKSVDPADWVLDEESRPSM